MNLTGEMASHLRGVYFGGNWTASSLRDNLADVTWQEATQQIGSLNTIATLVYHTNYFVVAASMVLQGERLDANDKYSFSHPPILSQEDWERFLEKNWSDAEHCASLIEQLPESRLWEDFWEGKYGNYYRNIQGVIEHTHYHLGQIALIKRILRQLDNA